MTKRHLSRTMEAIHETADGMHRAGIMDADAHASKTPRHLSDLWRRSRRKAQTRFAKWVNRPAPLRRVGLLPYVTPALPCATLTRCGTRAI